MARTPSIMPPLGILAPDFELLDPLGNQYKLDSLLGSKGILLMFICNHCPYVKHVAAELARIGEFCQEQEIGVAAIMSNDVANYPDDSPELMVTFTKEHGFTFPYLYDESQEVAKAYQAACTPDFFLFDANKRLYYRGQLDGSRPGNDVPVSGEDLYAAIEDLVLGKKAPKNQVPSIGCNIKWKAGK